MTVSNPEMFKEMKARLHAEEFPAQAMARYETRYGVLCRATENAEVIIAEIVDAPHPFRKYLNY
jgi:hypothetical protein